MNMKLMKFKLLFVLIGVFSLQVFATPDWVKDPKYSKHIQTGHNLPSAVKWSLKKMISIYVKDGSWSCKTQKCNLDDEMELVSHQVIVINNFDKVIAKTNLSKDKWNDAKQSLAFIVINTKGLSDEIVYVQGERMEYMNFLASFDGTKPNQIAGDYVGLFAHEFAHLRGGKEHQSFERQAMVLSHLARENIVSEESVQLAYKYAAEEEAAYNLRLATSAKK